MIYFIGVLVNIIILGVLIHFTYKHKWKYRYALVIFSPFSLGSWFILAVTIGVSIAIFIADKLVDIAFTLDKILDNRYRRNK